MKLRVSFIMLIVIVLYMLSTQPPLQAEETVHPQINSEAAILVEPVTGTVLFEKNATTKLSPASLTKIATAIYAIENGNLDDIVTVSENAYHTIGSSVYLEIGEKITLEQLVEGLLVNSANDAGVAIAEHLSGDVNQFSIDLNHFVEKKMGVENTHFENPHGLFHPKHYTTAEDLAKITRYAMNNQEFRELFGLKVLKWDGEKWDTTLYTHHKLLREMPYPGVTGGKTGYIEEAGYTLATSAEHENLKLIAITLNADIQIESYQDTEQLLDYGFENYIQKGQHVMAMNKVVDFRKLASANEINLSKHKPFTLQTKLKASVPSQAQLSLDTIPIKHHDMLLVITLLVFLWITFHYQKFHKL